ncbi:unnamed protein product [Fraxinus pennsylvanica]|uniref:Strictosidine synthase conserved region domain-containing protein n=1 Tax=Fraxinus pennsylvanica TaxID=56036 RepID=A0AAD1ZGX7_9LAMI|nr:unnamed protein product [Fraxinus pennsylvanica]
MYCVDWYCGGADSDWVTSEDCRIGNGDGVDGINFWLYTQNSQLKNHICSFIGSIPKTQNFRLFWLKLPIPVKLHYLMQLGGSPQVVIVKYSPEGKLLKILEDRQGKVVKVVSEVEEKDGKLWIGSVLMPFVAVYKLD